MSDISERLFAFQNVCECQDFTFSVIREASFTGWRECREQRAEEAHLGDRCRCGCVGRAACVGHQD